MPWKTTSVEEERIRLVTLLREGNQPLTDLADAFGISRKTAYKWVDRYEKSGSGGLSDASRAPKSSPQATPVKVVELLVELKKRHRTWGPKKLLVLMEKAHPRLTLPSASTAGEILRRHGLVRTRKARAGVVAPVINHRLTVPLRPNHVWCADFKGEFKLRNGQYCWPLTVTDGFTRYVLACVAMDAPLGAPTRDVFERLFGQYGLPDLIRTDNGTPFASNALWGLTIVSGHWLRNGVLPERGRRGKPQDNGRHERFHRTLKESTALPPAKTLRGQQGLFDRFCEEFNFLRPHEALGMRPPGQLYVASTREKPAREPEPTYPGHFYSCRTALKGTLRISNTIFFIGKWASLVNLGLEEIANERFRVHFARHVLGELDMRTGKVIAYGSRGAPGRPPPFWSAHEVHRAVDAEAS